jgi:hypothetical protein
VSLRKKRGSNEAVVYRSGFKIAPQAPQCAAFYTVYTPPSSRTASSAAVGLLLLYLWGRPQTPARLGVANPPSRVALRRESTQSGAK